MPKNNTATDNQSVESDTASLLDSNIISEIVSQPLTGQFQVALARVNLRGDEKGQSKYNLLLIDQESTDQLEAHAEEFKFTGVNDQGQHWVSVTMDGRSVAELMRKGNGHKALLMGGTLTITDTVNDRPVGHFTVAKDSVRPVTIADGGLQKVRQARETVASGETTGLASLRR